MRNKTVNYSEWEWGVCHAECEVGRLQGSCAKDKINFCVAFCLQHPHPDCRGLKKLS